MELSHQSNIIRLSSTCYAIKVITPLTSEDTFKLIYHSHVHSVITYGIIFWGNSPHNNDIFKIQKRIIRIMTKSRSRVFCRRSFKRLEIPLLHSQYIFSILLSVVKNKDLYTTNHEIEDTNTRATINFMFSVPCIIIFFFFPPPMPPPVLTNFVAFPPGCSYSVADF